MNWRRSGPKPTGLTICWAKYWRKSRPLDDAETLTYLHGTISTKRHTIQPPRNTDVSGRPFGGHLTARRALTQCWGTRICAASAFLGFPGTTQPGILDALNHLEFPYRWTTRFIALDKTRANKALTNLRRQWFNKRKSISQFLREVMHNEPVQLLDSDADNKMVDADAALQALGGDHVSFGYLTTSVCLTDTRSAPRRRKGAGGGARHQRPGLHHHPRKPQQRGGVAGQSCRGMFTPMSGSLWSIPSISRTSCRCHRYGPGQLAMTILRRRRYFMPRPSGSTPFRFSTHVGMSATS